MSSGVTSLFPTLRRGWWTALLRKLVRIGSKVDPSRTVRGPPTGRGGGPAKAVRRHPGAHRATPARRGRLGTVRMTPQVAQTRPRRDTSEGCHAPSTKNRAFSGSWRAHGPAETRRTTSTREEKPETRVGPVGGGRCTMTTRVQRRSRKGPYGQSRFTQELRPCPRARGIRLPGNQGSPGTGVLVQTGGVS